LRDIGRVVEGKQFDLATQGGETARQEPSHIVENKGSDRFTLPFRTGIIPMGLALSNEIKALLDGPNFAHLATLMPDGSPQSVPVWVGREEDHVVICTGEGSLKAKNIRRDPRVALSIVDFTTPTRKPSFVAEWSSAVLMAISGTWTLCIAVVRSCCTSIVP
jgi:hypothetical protein